MKILLIAFAIIGIFALALAFVAKNRKIGGGIAGTAVDQYRVKPLLTDNEKRWFQLIKSALPNEYLSVQVALNQLVKAEGKNWRAAKNKIDPRSIDFIVMNSEFAVTLAIEIDDRSHKRQDRQTDDEKKTNALRQAKIPLLRIPATPLLTSDEVKTRIASALGIHLQPEEPVTDPFLTKQE
ncbi:DUF2726 domain-containing protein [Pigmentiphaga sp.]|uniref:DUF2726 domain-containing protein n=1 Tax=Pigmentiphaga sp. TaxID=1977564 RepID=UPI0025E6FC6A|nr:DUF2726 domain-containing protein [Pigmentiphaga sp.]